MALDDFLPPPPKKEQNIDFLPPPPPKKVSAKGAGNGSEESPFGLTSSLSSPLSSNPTVPSVLVGKAKEEARVRIDKRKEQTAKENRTPTDGKKPDGGAGTYFMKELNTLNASLYKTPRLIYDVASMIPNAVSEMLGGAQVSYDDVLTNAGVMGFQSPLSIVDKLGDYALGTADTYEQRKEKFDKDVLESIKSGNYRDAGQQILNNFAASAPAIAGMFATGGATQGVQAGIVGTQAIKSLTTALPFISSRYQELQEIDAPQHVKIVNSVAHGLSEVIMDQSFGTKAILDNVISTFNKNGKDAGIAVAKEFSKGFLSTAIKRIQPLTSAVKNSIEEVSTQLAQNITDWATINPDIDITTGLADAGIIGGVTGGALASTGSVASAVFNSQAKQRLSDVTARRNELIQDIENENLPPVIKENLLTELEEVNTEISDIIENSENITANLPEEDKIEAEVIQSEIDNLEASLSDEAVTERTKDVITAEVDQRQEWLDVLSETGDILSNQESLAANIENIQDITDETQLARMYQDAMFDAKNSMSVDSVLAQHGINITEEDWQRYGDRNKIANNLARKYFKPKGSKSDIDSMIDEMNRQYFGGEQKISVEDVINFIEKHPDGPESHFMPSGNPTLAKIADQWKSVTGKRIRIDHVNRLVDKYNATQQEIAQAETEAFQGRDIDAITTVLEEEGFIDSGSINYQKLQEEIESYEENPEAYFGPLLNLMDKSVFSNEELTILKELADENRQQESEGRGSESISGNTTTNEQIESQTTGVTTTPSEGGQVNESIKNVTTTEEVLSSIEQPQQENETTGNEENAEIITQEVENESGTTTTETSPQIGTVPQEVLEINDSTGNGGSGTGLEGVRETQSNDNGKKPPSKEPGNGLSANNPGEVLNAIKNEDVKARRDYYGIGTPVISEKKSDASLIKEADDAIRNGYDVFKLSAEVLNTRRATSDVEQIILLRFQQIRESELNKANEAIEVATKSGNNAVVEEVSRQRDIIIEDLMRAYSAGEVAGTEAGRALRARRVMIQNDYSLAGMLMKRRKANDGTLTTEQVVETTEAFNELERLNKEYLDKIAQLEEEVSKRKAEKSVGRLRRAEKEKDRKASKDAIIKERETIKKNISDILRKQRSQLNANPIPVELFKPLAQLARNYIQEGIINLDEVISKIHNDIKGEFEEGVLTERHVRDALSGYGVENRPQTKDDVEKHLRELKVQARLISQIEDAETKGFWFKRGSKAHKKRSEEVKRLYDKLKQITSEPEHEHVPLSREEINLRSYKTRLRKRIEDMQERIAAEDYEPNHRQKLMLDEEAKELRDRFVRAKFEYDVMIEKDKLRNRPVIKKRLHDVVNVVGLVKALKATLDFSAVLRQGLFATVSHPVLAFGKGGAFWTMFNHAWDEKVADRWMNDLKESPMYDLMDKSGLAITDSRTARILAKEEDFTSNLAEKIPGIGRLVKGSERAYAGYLNKMRADVFEQASIQMIEDGFTYENNPEQFKAMASWVNTLTGRGDLGALERYSEVLSAGIWSPRLMASRVNFLASPALWANMPSEVRRESIKDFFIFVGFSVTALTLASLSGLEVEKDPRSSNFGKIKDGNRRYSIMGGLEQYIVLASRLITASTKNAKGIDKEFDPDRFGGQTRLDAVLRFMWGKSAPQLGIVTNLLAGKNVVGEQYHWQDLPKEFLPLMMLDINKAMQEDSAFKEVMLTLPFSMLGISISNYNPFEKKPKHKHEVDSIGFVPYFNWNPLGTTENTIAPRVDKRK